MSARRLLAACPAVAVGLGVPALPASAASKRAKTAPVKRCHIAKRTGKNVRVCPPKNKKRAVKDKPTPAASLAPNAIPDP